MFTCESVMCQWNVFILTMPSPSMSSLRTGMGIKLREVSTLMPR